MKKILNILLGLSIICNLILWCIFKEFNFLVYIISSMNFFNISYSFLNIEKRIYFLFFNITIFLFLLSRPFIDALYKYKWNNYTYETGSFALIAIGISLVGLLIGQIIKEKLNKNNKAKECFLDIEEFSNKYFIKNMRLVSLIIYIFCLVFNLMTGMEKIIFIQNNTYLDYYIEYSSKLPVFVKGISTMMPAALVIYLATMPNKKKAIIPLGLYLFSALPNLIVGSRGAISEALIFVFLYFFLRDNINKILEKSNGISKEKWITKLMKKFIFISVPVIILIFSAYNYSRFGIEKENNMNPIVDFAYSQGVSFTVVTRGYKAIPYLPDIENKNYTFGPFIDYVTRGTPAQILFGVEGLGASNSIVRATEGNNFNAALSYYLYGARYLQGHGAGSSYIIELYADYGFMGIAIFSILLGMLFGSIGNEISSKWFKNVILLRVLMDVFIIPRGSALSWLTFFIAPQFWVPVICCWIGAKILSKKNGIAIKI